MADIRFVPFTILVEPDSPEQKKRRRNKNILTKDERLYCKNYDHPSNAEYDRNRALVLEAIEEIRFMPDGRLSFPSKLPDYVRKLGRGKTTGYMQMVWDWVNQYVLFRASDEVEAIFRMIYIDIGRDLKTPAKLGFATRYEGTFTPMGDLTEFPPLTPIESPWLVRAPDYTRLPPKTPPLSPKTVHNSQ